MGTRVANIDDFETVYKLFNQIFKLHLDRRPDIYRWSSNYKETI
ncbi:MULTISPECIES: hypothetical protein [Clostridium]|nr:MULTISPECIES: hypothetical protein [Clostridium]